jgi:hypothetical protein
LGFEVHEPEQRTGLAEVMVAADITVAELWLQYFSLGGCVGEFEVQAYVEGVLSLPVSERDLLAMSANEMIDGGPPLHAPYSDQMERPEGNP